MREATDLSFEDIRDMMGGHDDMNEWFLLGEGCVMRIDTGEPEWGYGWVN